MEVARSPGPRAIRPSRSRWWCPFFPKPALFSTRPVHLTESVCRWASLAEQVRILEKKNKFIPSALPFSRTIPVRTPQSASRTEESKSWMSRGLVADRRSYLNFGWSGSRYDRADFDRWPACPVICSGLIRHKKRKKSRPGPRVMPVSLQGASLNAI